MNDSTNAQRWQPTATWPSLKRRAQLLKDLRAYFEATNALEVQTPLMALHGTTDPALESFVVQHHDSRLRYLQTSPEYAMKRLLAAGSGDIYQVTPAFRREESSRLHLEEFTLLEWYRVGFDHHQLMDDVVNLLHAVGFTRTVERASYAALCQHHVGFDPHTVETATLAGLATTAGVQFDTYTQQDRALLLDWLFGFCVLPALPPDSALLIYDFPREHAAYARLRGTPPVAERFELVVGGVELANGFHEVCDPVEQHARHSTENTRRGQRGLSEVPLDARLLNALEAGMPPCAGVALGLDRLMMALCAADAIRDVVAFVED